MGIVRILYKADKSVTIIHPIKKSKRDDETEAQWLIRVFDKSTPVGVEYEDVDESTLPSTRIDRMGWEGEKGKGITINNTKSDTFKKEQRLKQEVKLELELMAKERIEKRNK
jgi:hypothetical protein